MSPLGVFSLFRCPCICCNVELGLQVTVVIHGVQCDLGVRAGSIGPSEVNEPSME